MIFKSNERVRHTFEYMDFTPTKDVTILHDIRNPIPEEHMGKYNIVYAPQLLFFIERVKVQDVVTSLVALLANEGELWVFTPSLDWIGRELQKDMASPATIPLIYGAQNNEHHYHRSGFTLAMLRVLCEEAGLYTRRCELSESTISIGREEYPVWNNYYVGLKYDA